MGLFPIIVTVRTTRSSNCSFLATRRPIQFVVADAGMGKGALTLCGEIVKPIDHELHEISKRQMKDYKDAIASFARSKGENRQMPEEPPMRMLIIPANSSASSFLNILNDNEGRGLLFETEGDTLSNTFKADYGNYSDALRKAFHHETVSFSRRTERTFEEVEHPCLSTVLAGTPEQVRRLIPDTENGLMSRFMFYHLPFKRGFRNVFATISLSDSKSVKFRQIGEKFKQLRIDFLRRGEFEFSIGEIEQQLFCDYFQKTNDECCDEIDDRIQGEVCRMGLMAYRIMMVLTIVRQLGNYVPHDRNDTSPTRLVCNTEDFETAMTMIDVLVQHMAFEYVRLSNKSHHGLALEHLKSTDIKRMRLYDMLPEQFTKKEYAENVERLGENTSTTDKWLPWYINRGLLMRDGQGRFKKLSKERKPDTNQ